MPTGQKPSPRRKPSLPQTPQPEYASFLYEAFRRSVSASGQKLKDWDHLSVYDRDGWRAVAKAMRQPGFITMAHPMEGTVGLVVAQGPAWAVQCLPRDLVDDPRAGKIAINHTLEMLDTACARLHAEHHRPQEPK